MLSERYLRRPFDLARLNEMLNSSDVRRWRAIGVDGRDVLADELMHARERRR